MGKLRLSILWHMHQPFYLDPVEGRFVLPWVRLHSIKDYLDMPLLVSEVEGIGVNFNLAPSLVEQWEAWRQGAEDRIQELCGRPVSGLAEAEREELINWLFRAHPERMIGAFSEYAEFYRRWQSRGASSLQDAELERLKFWFHLAWLDPLFCSEPIPAKFLTSPERMTDKAWPELNEYCQRFPDRLRKVYGDLFKNGDIEVSVSPFYHPILPLLIATESAQEALPDITLPEERFSYPPDARWQLRRARELGREWLGRDCPGIWPSEGSVSEAALAMMAEEGFAWAASDEQVLANSLGLANLNLPEGERAALLYRPWRRRFGERELQLVFRDHFLSDRIGFSYASWNPDSAVDDFLAHLAQIRKESPLEESLVSVILDGENCWEYYREDGLPFLRTLYRRLAETPWLQLDTISQHLTEMEPRELPGVKAGSWIGGNFSIWIGGEEDNRSWDYLGRVRRDLMEKSGGVHPMDGKPMSASLERAWRSLFIAEGSDWNWWYGHEHNSLDDELFDRIYRMYLKNVYLALDLEPPEFLHKPIPRNWGRLGDMVPLGLSEIRVDGKVSHFYEWENGARFLPRSEGGAMSRVDRLVKEIWLAFGAHDLFLRIDFNSDNPGLTQLKRMSVEIKSPQPRRFRIELAEPHSPVHAEEPTSQGWRGISSQSEWAQVDLLELRLPWTELPVQAGQELFFTLTLLGQAGILEVVPTGHPLVFVVPESHYDKIMWNV